MPARSLLVIMLLFVISFFAPAPANWVLVGIALLVVALAPVQVVKVKS